MANFLDLVKEMARGKDVQMKPDEDIDFADLDITMLDMQAEKLSADEISTFIYGYYEFTTQITSKYKIEALNKTLDRILVDDLHYNFYVE